MKKIKLGEAMSIKHGFAFKSENYVEKSDYALITLANISESNTFQLSRDKLTYYGADFPSNFILNEGDLIMPLTEQAIGLLGNSAFIPKEQGITFVLNQRVGKVIVNDSLIDKYYLHYLLSTRSVKEQLEYRASGTSQRNISPENVYDVEVFLPDIETQHRIGRFLYSLEQKSETNKAINDNLEQQMHLIFKNMIGNAQSGHIKGENITAKEICSIVTGREDANFSTINGKYKFFTCSQDVLTCDNYAFNSPSILIAGNGEFNVKHYSGKFNAYQRTYVLSSQELYYALVYLSCLYRINSFKKGSAGSIVKFITKNDIENIPIFIPNDSSYLHLLNKCIFLQEKIQFENEKLIILRDWLLPMLMNGQATIGT